MFDYIKLNEEKVIKFENNLLFIKITINDKIKEY
jgi:hypothetical protein